MKNHRERKLSDKEVKGIQRLLLAKTPLNIITDIVDICSTEIFRIQNGKTYKHLKLENNLYPLGRADCEKHSLKADNVAEKMLLGAQEAIKLAVDSQHITEYMMEYLDHSHGHGKRLRMIGNILLYISEVMKKEKVGRIPFLMDKKWVDVSECVHMSGCKLVKHAGEWI